MLRLVDSNRYTLRGTEGRFIHLASVHKGFREYICFLDTQTQRAYIEEISGGHMSYIEDSALATEIANFLQEHGVLDIHYQDRATGLPLL